MKNEIQRIISGENQVKYGTIIQTIFSYLRRSQETSRVDKASKQFREEEEKYLRDFIEKNQLWITTINLDNYISEGAEQKVYLRDGKSVWKLNDAIFYSSWSDYLVNLLLNNYFFADTAYQLKGFFTDKEILYAVVEQAFVKANQKTDLLLVKQFMQANGFLNTRNNDYYHPEWGIILEDLHDENVLTQNDILYFIDTVFYVVSPKTLSN